MGLRIRTNIPAMAVARVLSQTSDEFTKTSERLASGQRIIRSADDAAGLSIAENMRAQMRSTTQAERNANDAISFVQVAEGGVSEIGNILVRLRELAIQAASDTVDDRTRSYIHQEGRSLVQEMARISNGTNFNGIPLLNAENKGILQFQVGPNNTDDDRLDFDVQGLDVRPERLDVDRLDLETSEGAMEAINKLDEGMAKLYASRSAMGVMQQRLESAVRGLETRSENLSIARSRIMDTDIAHESTELVRQNMLRNAGISVLAQANMVPMSALKLLNS